MNDDMPMYKVGEELITDELGDCRVSDRFLLEGKTAKYNPGYFYILETPNHTLHLYAEEDILAF